MGMVHKLFGKPPHGPGDKGEIGSGGKEQYDSNDKSKIKYKDVDNELFLGDNNENQQTPEQNARADLDRRTEEAGQRQIENQQTSAQNARADLDRRTEEARQRQIENQQTPVQIGRGDLDRRTENTNRSKLQRIKRAVGSGARYYGNGMKEKMKKKAQKKLTLGNVARKTAGITLAGIAATGGAIAGMTSGDPSKAIQYATGAAVGGYKFGEGTAKAAIDSVGVGGTMDYMKQNYYGEDEYNEKQIKDNTKAFQKNFENKEYIRKKFDNDKEKMNEFMNEVVPMCQEYGLTDMKDAETVWDMKEDPSIKASDKQIINAVQISKERDTTKLSAKDDKEFNETLKMRAKGNEDVAIKARNLIDIASQTRYGHTKKNTRRTN